MKDIMNNKDIMIARLLSHVKDKNIYIRRRKELYKLSEKELLKMSIPNLI